MTDFCIQIQPSRAHGIDTAEIGKVAEDLSAASGLVSRFAIVPGEGWINLMFATPKPAALWALLWRELFGHAAFGECLRECSIATCEGVHSWDDYLLLHHFDQALPLDRLS